MCELDKLKIGVLPGNMGKQEGWYIALSVGKRGSSGAGPRHAANPLHRLGLEGLLVSVLLEVGPSLGFVCSSLFRSLVGVQAGE